MNFITPSSMSC